MHMWDGVECSGLGGVVVGTFAFEAEEPGSFPGKANYRIVPATPFIEAIKLTTSREWRIISSSLKVSFKIRFATSEHSVYSFPRLNCSS